MDKVIIGIDCGANGGIAVFREGKTTCYRMPKDVHSIAKILTENKGKIYIEKITMWRSDTKIGGKTFGIMKMMENYNMVINVANMLQLPIQELSAKTWQKYYKGRSWETKTQRKARYKALAQRLYPEAKVTLWNADALLIMDFGRKIT